MTQPTSLLNATRGQSIDTIYAADGVGKIKLSIGDVNAGYTPHAGWQGVASHMDGSAFGASDGIEVIGGVAGGNAVKLLVDTSGRPLIGQVADDSALGGGAYTFPQGMLADETATDSVDEGDIGIPRITLDRKQIIAEYAHAAGGATPYSLLSAATTNLTLIKAAPGKLTSILASNVNAAVRYLKLYNKASAAPVLAADTPILRIALPANGAPVAIDLGVGLDFSLGIGLALTTGSADTDTGAVAAGELMINLGYK